MRRLAWSSLVLLLACAGSGGGAVSSDSQTGTSAGSTGVEAAPTTGETGAVPTTGATGTGTGGDGVAGLEVMTRLSGLWTGPVTMTPLGTFPVMNMDLRAASGEVLFGRVDLDALNSLRFAFEIEDHGSGPVLVYRNGGYFLGILRDSRAALVEHTPTSWRFCSVTAQGCDYIDASFSFESDDHLILEVDVKGAPHVYWDARRDELRPLPEPFPADEAPLAKDAPFPAMPGLKVDVSWAEPLPQDGAVLVILTTQTCDAPATCVASRSLVAPATAGATAASLLLEQIHGGDYMLTAVLDRNGNITETLAPDAGDGVSLPNQAITVAPTGDTAVKATIVVDL